MPNKCLDISRANRDPGASLCSWDCSGGQNQAFDFEYDYGHSGHGGAPGGGYNPGQSYPAQSGASYGGGRQFTITSELSGKVLDIERANANPDAKVIVYKKKSPPGRNQLWYTDQQGVLRSALNDFALQASGSGHQLKMHPFHGGHDQQWRFQDRKIVNHNGECLDIKGASHSDGADVIVYSYKGSSNQHWRQEFV
jgi:hypothetical protein